MARPVSFRVLAMAAAGLAASLVGFLFWGSYTRTERATGVLWPEAGLVQVRAPQSGLVTALRVREGVAVARDEPLAVVGTERAFSSGGSLHLALARELEREIESVASRIEGQRRLFEQESQALGLRVRALRDRGATIARQNETQREMVGLLRTRLARSEKLVAGGVAAPSRLEEARRVWLDARLRLAEIEEVGLSTAAALRAAEAERGTLATANEARLAQLGENLHRLRRERIRARGEEGYTLRAPASGRVATVLVREGERVALDAPLLTLVPPETRLYAELYVTSRARGALRVEQPALLALRGFPPREFGFQRGRIQAISRTPIEPQDLLVPLPLAETVYRVRVALESQRVRRGGAEYVLQPGMLLDAELPTERRHLIEWIFEPLLDLRDRGAV
ncbi:MAG: HlyD family efflux transporter periplasmic adaptor subunit [Proteobacteria bacterium]|nr:HlyD family efflux transporter periplasmic adaptor subunit [Pseudomonadota bacterium]